MSQIVAEIYQRRGRSRQHLQTHQVEALAKQADERDRQADERDRRWFMRNVIASGIVSTLVSTITGWLFWRLPRPQPQGRDVAVKGVLEHGVSISVLPIDGGGQVTASLTVVPASEREQASHA